MAFAALVIKEELRLSDRETVEQIRENPLPSILRWDGVLHNRSAV